MTPQDGSSNGNARTQAREATVVAGVDPKTQMLFERMSEQAGTKNPIAIQADINGGITMPRKEPHHRTAFIDEAGGAQMVEMLDEQPVKQEAARTSPGVFSRIAQLYKRMDEPLKTLLDEAVALGREAAGIPEETIMIYLRESSAGAQAADQAGDGFSVVSLKSGDAEIDKITPELMAELRIADSDASGKITQLIVKTDPNDGGRTLTPTIEGSPPEVLTKMLNVEFARRGLGGFELAESCHVNNGKHHGGLVVLTRSGTKLTAEKAQILQGLSDIIGELIGLKNEREETKAKLDEQKIMLGDAERIIESKREIPPDVLEKMNGDQAAASIYRLLQATGEIMNGEIGALSTFSTVQNKTDVQLISDMVIGEDGKRAKDIAPVSIYSRGVLPTLTRVAMQENEAICISSGKSSVVFTVDMETGEFVRFGAVDGGNPWKSGEGAAQTETAAISYAIKNKKGQVRVFSFPIFKEVQVTEKTSVRAVGKTQKEKEFLEAMQILVEEERAFGAKDLRRIRLACAQMADEITLQVQAGKSLKDGLTGAYNRVYFMEEMLREVRKARRSDGEYPFAVLLADVDNFKKVNDTYGHGMGDVVLKTVADIIRSVTRSTDVPCRYGGEEFTVLLEGNTARGVDAEIVKSIAEEIRREVEAHVFKTSNGEKFSVTLSIGATVTAVERDDARGSDEEILASVIEIADNAECVAKGNGRGVEIASKYGAVGFDDGQPAKNRTFFCNCATGRMEKVTLTKVRGFVKSQHKEEEKSVGRKRATAVKNRA
ncbi:Diguanylate cyclase, GGDEF domain [Candidatus Gugararchaeum adminiculabundum]|nr:Diguanylate cyclase, GGDEF domain [Candidatus Gugararchaeum adminiculabundum]